MTTGAIDVACTMEHGRLSIDGILMHRPAWAVFDVAKLWVGPSQIGDDLRIPGRPYPKPNVRRGDVTVKNLRMVIDGRFDVFGAPHANQARGLQLNMRYLRANVTDPTFTAFGTRTVSVLDPTLTETISAPAHVSLAEGEILGPLWRCVLELSFPTGMPA